MSRIANEIRSEIASLTRLLTAESVTEASRPTELRVVNGRIYEVGWSKEGPDIAFALKNVPYRSIYSYLLKNEQYNFILRDGSLIQLLYKFSAEQLIEQRLCYFPRPRNFSSDFTGEQEEREDIAEEDNSALLESALIENETESYDELPLIRIDYNPGQHKPVSHAATHLHLGYTKNCRIPSSRPVAPITFILFILRSFYPDDLLLGLGEKLEETRSFKETILGEERECVHLAVPSL